MPRTGATYNLPLPAVVAGTTATAVWANTTLNDIATALTNSVPRDGSGAMTGALQLADGSVAAPGAIFSADPNSGLYRIGTDHVGFSAGGVYSFSYDGDGVRLKDGSRASPSISFNSADTVGLFKASATNGMGMSADIIEQEAVSTGHTDYRIKDENGDVVWTIRRRNTANGNHLEFFRTVAGVPQTAGIKLNYNGTIELGATPTTPSGTVGIVNVTTQPLDAGLTAIAALGATAGLLEKTALDTYTERAIGVAASTSIPTRADADARYGVFGELVRGTSSVGPSVPTSYTNIFAIWGSALFQGSSSVTEPTDGVLQTAVGGFFRVTADFIITTGSVDDIEVLLQFSTDNSSWNDFVDPSLASYPAALFQKEAGLSLPVHLEKYINLPAATRYIRAVAKSGTAGSFDATNLRLAIERVGF